MRFFLSFEICCCILVHLLSIQARLTFPAQRLFAGNSVRKRLIRAFRPTITARKKRSISSLRAPHFVLTEFTLSSLFLRFMAHSRSKRIIGEILATLNTMLPNARREFFGAAAKFLVPEEHQNDQAPITGYESSAEELRSFQAGFSDLTKNQIAEPAENIKEVIDALSFISDCRPGKKRRPRDISHKLGNLKRRTRKALRALGTRRPARGTGVFFKSLSGKYVTRKRKQANLRDRKSSSLRK